MQRHREIAASPQRTAGEAWRAIGDLVAVTLDRSPNIAVADVNAAMAAASGVGRMLIAGGHLETSPIVVVAAQLWLEIRTVSGDRALTIEENPNPVPGAAEAEDWTVYLPPAAPLAKIVQGAVEADSHLSADGPTEPSLVDSQQAVGALNQAALTSWAEEKP